MNNQSNELDEIKAILRALAERQTATQHQLDQLIERQNSTQHQLDHLTGIVESSIPDLTEMVGSVLSGLDEYTAEMRAIQTADRSDRASERLMEVRARNEFRSDMRGLQNESRNLLRELADLRRQDRGG
jgi:response regulator of citrate/malate metabolism